ncbi:MAG: limonene-1,2-epoxide hydrolase family protein [Parvibaculum sp.]|uniref:limonene-1,2-epoxide hydrolase family protein n=1 Tax=Parvibaculum sp. TaxID=2024848 RepID=UPI0027184277|nr:limonene-1,2-epoxide hydrolase family protein [Parvibaculum sp.]MDO8837309.1 limonene-1,2-epoxide hydrolase family protein [Parvibaculum sp.]MDP2124857.1 limonene-1,2-epoxide hydrolase family protein [Parvibaculum sp.]
MTNSMSPAETVAAFLDLMMKKDYDKGLAYVTGDVEYDNVPIGKVQGPAGIRAVLEPFFGPTVSNEYKVLRALTDGGTVILERLDRHLLDNGWVELPVTGVFEVRDGKIALWRDYFDAATIISKWPAG